MNICIYSKCNKHGERISEYIRNVKRCRMNIRIYSKERKETNINEYEYIRLKIFEYIRMSEYSLHTGPELEKIQNYQQPDIHSELITIFLWMQVV